MGPEDVWGSEEMLHRPDSETEELEFDPRTLIKKIELSMWASKMALQAKGLATKPWGFAPKGYMVDGEN